MEIENSLYFPARSLNLDSDQSIKLELTLPMIKRMELVAARVSESIGELLDFEEDRIQEISMSTLEVCLNSIEHSKSQDRNLYLTFTGSVEEIKITICDKGIGFNFSEVEEPDIDTKLKPGTYKRGWGLKLIRNLMDSLEFFSDKNGTKVTMIKRKNP